MCYFFTHNLLNKKEIMEKKQDTLSFIAHKAYNLRLSSLIESGAAGSGHPSTCLSAADIVATLFFYSMKFDPDNFENPNNDRFILSKGHASALLYAAWKELGKITADDLLTYRQFNSVLEGHPTFRFAYTEAATGALGTGLSVGVGQALTAQLNTMDYTTYVLLGDAEMAEGAIWEAIQVAAHYKLDNLVGIIDCNRLGQSEPTLFGHDVTHFATILEAFGWQTFIIDGHSIADLITTFDAAHVKNKKPKIIIAKTFKGYGVTFAQDKEGFHGKAFTNGDLEEALKELSNSFKNDIHYSGSYQYKPTLPQPRIEQKKITLPLTIPLANFTEEIATRKAFGLALAQLGAVCNTIIALDADVKNSTYTELFEKKFPERFFQCFVAEQNMVGMAIGFARRGYIPFVSTFAAFFSRAHDHIRMAAIGKSPLRLVGSHAGISIGQDGPSQMGLEDIAMMRCLPESIVLYPCDGVSTHALVEQMANYTTGISYLRTTRANTPLFYTKNELFPIGGCKVLRSSALDTACIVAAGITVFEALKAYDFLRNKNIHISIIDCYSIKPLDATTIINVARSSGNTIITVEDHYIQGGLGEAVCAKLHNTGIQITMLAVTELPRSGKPEELLAWAHIDAETIIKMVMKQNR